MVLQDLMNNQDMIMICDGYAAYNYYNTIQRCWAHILRESKDEAGTDDADRDMLHARLHQIFLNAKHMDQADQKQCDILTQEVLVIAKSWSEKNVKFGVKLANAAPNLFTFLRYPGMAPTNNAAEHAIRQAVLHRKVKGKLNNWKGMRRLGIR